MGFVVQAVGLAVLAAGAVVETIMAYQLLATLATSAILSTLSSKLFGPKVPQNVGVEGIQVMGRSALEHRKIVYGQAMVSGPIFYNNVSGTDNEYLWYGVALCDGESTDVLSVWFDGDEIPKASIDWTPGSNGGNGTGTGDVSTSKWVGDNSTAAVQIFYSRGHADQVVCSKIDSAFTDIDSTHRLRGITHVICQLLYNLDTEKVWESGPPRNIKAVVKGRKLYDPRLDTTQIINTTTSPVTYGSSTHRTGDSSTWVWSDNPALCVADYLMNVMGVASTSINWPSIADAADDCDVSVFVDAASPQTPETRFTCNGALSMGVTHKDNLDGLLSSMDGRLAYSSGTWKLRASVWEASSVSITADDLAGDVDVRGSAPKSERFNGVKGFFIDPDRNYEAVEFPHVTDSAYVTRDNGKTILYDLQLPMTNSVTMAQRLAYRNLSQGNNQVICKLKLNTSGSKIAIGDVVSVTLDGLSWSSKTFRCIEWSRNEGGTFDVTLREDESTDYDDPAGSAYGVGGTGGVTVPAGIVPPPTGLTATGGVGGIRLDWTNPAVSVHDHIDIYQDTDNSWSGATKIASVRANSYFVSIASGTTYYYWVRAVKAPDGESLRSPDSDTSTVSAAATAGGGGADGYNAATLTAYKRSASDPGDDPGASITYTFATAGWTPGNSWSKTIPAAGSPTLPVWALSATAYSNTSTDDVLSADWSAATKILQDGVDGTDGATGSTGADGLNVATAYIYQRTLTDSAPSVPSGTTTYTFATGGMSGLDNGWTATVPAQTSPESPYLWVTLATASASGSTDTIGTGEWQSPQKLAQDGSAGAAGADAVDSVAVSYTNNSHAVPVDNAGAETWTGSGGLFYAYEGATVLTLDTNTQGTAYPVTPGEYRLDITKVSGDTLTEPAITGATTTTATIADWASDLTTATVYRITAYILTSNSTQVSISTDATLSPSDQGADGAGGAAGADGLNSATVSLYHKNTSDSTPPSAFSGTFTYTFSTAVLSGGTLNGWSQTPPTLAQGEYLWVRQAAAVSSSTTDSVPTAEFAGAVVLGGAGTDGATGGTGSAGTDGLNNAIVFLYNSNTSDVTPPSAFSGTFTYTFATAVLSGGTLNGWTQAAPDIAAGEYLWLRQATASANTSTDSVPTAEFSAAAVIAIGGSDGATGSTGAAGTDGDDAIAMNYTNNSHAVPVTNTGTETWTGSGGKCYIFEGPTLLTLNTNTQTGSYAGLANSEYNLNITKVSGDTLTEPAITGQTTTTATIADWASNLTQATVYQLDAYVQDSGGNQVTITEYITLSPADQGADGTPGTDGTSPIVSSLTNPSHVVTAWSDGTNYSLTGAGGTHEVVEGVTDRTTSATHSVSGTATKNGLTMSVNSSGVYSLADGSASSPQVFWTSDSETFTLRAVYSGVTNDKTYTIAKAKSGGITLGGSIQASVALSDSNSGPGLAQAKFQVNSDGDIYESEHAASYASTSTWIGDGSNSDYQVMLDIGGSSDENTSGDELGVWYLCSTSREWNWQVAGGLKSFQGELYFRRVLDSVVLKSIPVTVSIDDD